MVQQEYNMAEFYVDKHGKVHEYDTTNYGKEKREKYELCIQIINTGKEVLALVGHDIPFTCESEKYNGWRGTMKSSY